MSIDQKPSPNEVALFCMFPISRSLKSLLYSLAENGRHLERLHGKGTYSSVANRDKVALCNPERNI